MLLDEWDEVKQLDPWHHTLHCESLVSVELGDGGFSHCWNVLQCERRRGKKRDEEGRRGRKKEEEGGTGRKREEEGRRGEKRIHLQISSSLDFSILNSKITRDCASSTERKRVTNISKIIKKIK